MDVSHEGSSGIEKWENSGVDAVILDVMLPGMDGFSVLKEIRKKSEIPVIMLTAKGDGLDRIIGLE